MVTFFFYCTDIVMVMFRGSSGISDDKNIFHAYFRQNVHYKIGRLKGLKMQFSLK